MHPRSARPSSSRVASLREARGGGGGGAGGAAAPRDIKTIFKDYDAQSGHYRVFLTDEPGASIVLGATGRVAHEFTRGTHGGDGRLVPPGVFGNQFRHVASRHRRRTGVFEQFGGPDADTVTEYFILLRTICWKAVKTIPVMPTTARTEIIEAVAGAVRDALVFAANAGHFRDGVLSIPVTDLDVQVERRG